MFRSSLFLKTFTAIIMGVLIMCAIFYFTTVPMINSLFYEMEEKAGRTILNNIYLLVEQSHSDLQSWKKSILEAHKKELRHLVDIAASLIEIGSQKGESPQHILDTIRNLRYGTKEDYIWVSDYNSTLIAHPDPKLNGKNFSKVRDVKGNLIVPPMVKGALSQGEGYYSYFWRRLGQTEPIEKLSYYRNIPKMKWVVGTGVYIDDIQKEIESRKKELIKELRQLIHTTKFAGEGYLFIFDSNINMIIHPNPNIENTNFAKLIDPSSGRPIGEELIKAASSPFGKLTYKWDKPADPGNYKYDKIAWVRYFPAFDWYIALSVYKDDLERSAIALTKNIVTISLGALLLAIIGGYLFVRAFTRPIAKMAESAKRITNGDLSSTIQLNREDEIGLLAKAFNNMVSQIRDQISNLEDRVKERTKELATNVNELKRRNKEIETINYMGDMLQACRTEDEILTVTVNTIKKIFPFSSGKILRLDRGTRSLEYMKNWGNGNDDKDRFLVFDCDDCWAIRRGKTYVAYTSDESLLCSHIREKERERSGEWDYFCVPMNAQGETFGVLHAKISSSSSSTDYSTREENRKNIQRLLETVAEHTALSLSNLLLRKRLEEQSSKDPLTDLYNRRYAEEAIKREIKRIERLNESLGVLLLDIDHFKKINDTWGHDAGDEVLRRLSEILRNFFRGHDIVCRYGGEEFLIVLTKADSQIAFKKGEKLRAIIERDLKCKWQGQPIPVTVSIGVAQYPCEDLSFNEVIEMADKALYKAKELGRNRVVTSTPCS